MNSRPRWRRIGFWRRGARAPRTAGPRAGPGVESLEPRFLLSASDSSVPVLASASDLIPILLAHSAPATNPSGGDPDANAAPDATSGLIAISTPGATGKTTVSIVSIGTVGGTVNLPDVASPAVVDVLSTVTAENVYHVTDLTDTFSVELDLRPVSETEPLADQLAVSSASGESLLASLPTYSTAGESWTVRTTKVPDPGAGLFVKVEYPPNPANGPASSTGPEPAYFILRITRQELTSTSPVGSTPSPSPTGDPLRPPPPPSAPGPATRPPTPLPIPERFLAPPTSAAATAVGGRVLLVPGAPSGPLASPPPVSTGPLPMRSAAPLGGVLATGDPVPQVNRTDAVVIDLELTGLVPGEAEGPRAAPEEDTAASSGRLAEVRGPGGFPLLASAPSWSLAAPLTDSPWAANPRSPEADLLPPADAPAPATSPTSTSTRPATRPHPSAGSGLTVALALVSGLVLPDLADALHRDEPPSGPGPPRPSRRRRGLVPRRGD